MVSNKDPRTTDRRTDRKSTGSIVSQIVIRLQVSRVSSREVVTIASHSAHPGYGRGGGRKGIEPVRQSKTFIDFGKLLAEQFAIFSGDDGFDGGPQHFAIVLLEDSSFPELDANIQSGLSSHAHQDPIGSFLGNDFLDNIGSTVRVREAEAEGGQS